jgi:hypothetical protein
VIEQLNGILYLELVNRKHAMKDKDIKTKVELRRNNNYI